jgi:AcrR family transcriptional regulator
VEAADMGIAERRTRHKASLRNEILDAARALFVEEGYESVSMRKVAQRIEYSPTTIYLYFKDKDELFQAICEEMFSKLSRKLEEQTKKAGDDPVEALREGLRVYAKFALKHPEHYTVTFMLPRSHVVPFEGSLGQQTFQSLRGGVVACVEAGAFRPVDIDVAAQSLWAAVHGVVALFIAKCDKFPFVKVDRLVDDTIDTMIRGLRRP